MKKNESVNSLLKYSGGFTGDAYKKSVRIHRKTGRDYSVYNVEEFDPDPFMEQLNKQGLPWHEVFNGDIEL